MSYYSGIDGHYPIAVGNFYICSEYGTAVSVGSIVEISEVDYNSDTVTFNFLGYIFTMSIQDFKQKFKPNSDETSRAKCDCGSWKTYGIQYNSSLHAHWCNLRECHALK